MSSEAVADQRVFPTAITEAVRRAIGKTFGAMYGEEPREAEGSEVGSDEPYVAGIISFVGEDRWSLCWMLPKATAEKMAAQFMGGMEVAFESDDMADIAGELVNILAGEVVAQLESDGVKAQMSLPTVARGTGLRVLPDHGAGVQRLAYQTGLGPFWFRLACGQESIGGSRMPGA